MAELTDDGIDFLLGFLPIFQGSGPLYEHQPVRQDEGTFELPYTAYSDAVSRFKRALYKTGMTTTFDWAQWQEDAERYVRDPGRLEAADLETLRRLLTLHVRNERFCDGHFAAMIECGHIRAILERLNVLREKGQTRPESKGG